jgi:hypothetical protein
LLDNDDGVEMEIVFVPVDEDFTRQPLSTPFASVLPEHEVSVFPVPVTATDTAVFAMAVSA